MRKANDDNAAMLEEAGLTDDVAILTAADEIQARSPFSGGRSFGKTLEAAIVERAEEIRATHKEAFDTKSDG